MAKIPIAQAHPILERDGVSETEVCAVVVTLTVTIEATVALTVTLQGTEHVAPVGAPEQLSVAVPPIPCPPIVSM
jgi:hypothetical protein